MKTNKNLNLLLGGQLVSQTGDKFYLLALSMMVLNTTGSAAKMGLALFAGMMPLVVVGFFSGVVVDRMNRKTIIVATDLIRAVVITAVAWLYFREALTFPMLLLSQALLGVNAAFFNPAIPSIIPLIVNEADLSRANAKTQFISGFSNIAGPALGGMLVSIYGTLAVFVLNAASYAISAVMACFICIPAVPHKADCRFTSAFRQGYRAIAADKPLLVILFMVFVIHFFVGSIAVAIPVIANVFGEKGPAVMGYLQTAFGAGAVVMAAVLSASAINGREAALLFTAVGAIGVLLLAMGLSTIGALHLWPLMALFLLISAAIIMAGTSFQSLIQKRTPAHLTGRVFGVVSSVGNCSIPLAMLAYGMLFEQIEMAQLIGLSGLLVVLMAGLSWLAYRNSEGSHRPVTI